MKKKRNVISPKFDGWILLLAIICAGVVACFVATDYLPAWSPTWGTVFETANNFAISFLVTTIFYFFTVYRPEKRKYEYTSLLLQSDKKQIDRAIRGLGLFLVAQANAHSSDETIPVDKIDMHSLRKAQCVFSSICADDSVWEVLFRMIGELEEQMTIFAAKYEGYISSELNDCIRLFLDNTTFYIVRTATNRTALLKKDGLLSEYYYSAERFIACTNLMDNAR